MKWLGIRTAIWFQPDSKFRRNFTVLNYRYIGFVTLWCSLEISARFQWHRLWQKKTLNMRYPYFLFQTHTHIHVHAPKIHDRQGMSFWECKSIFYPDWQRQAIPSWSNWETRRKLCYMLLGALFSINQRVFNLYFLVRKVGMEIGMISFIHIKSTKEQNTIY